MRESSSSVAHELGGEAVLARPAGVALLAAEQQLARGRLAEHLRQQQRAGVAGHQADADLGRDQAHAVACRAAGRSSRRTRARRPRTRRPRRRSPARGWPAPRGSCAGSPRSSPPTPPRQPRARPAGRRPAEKWSPAPRSTTQRTRRRAPAASIASAIAFIVSRSQALRRAWRSQRDQPRGVEVGGRDGHPAGLLPSASTAVGSGSPRAVRWTMRVLCSATGSEPGSSRVTAKRARSAGGAASARRRGRASGGRLDVHVQRRRDRVAVGHDAVAAEPRLGGQDRADGLRVDVHGLHAQHVVAAAVDADPRRGRARTRSGEVQTRPRSPER